MALDIATLLEVAAVFALAGLVKGVIGLGLPTISLGLLTATIGLHPAMVLLLVPSFVTNLWQALSGGHGVALLGRLWPFLLTATAAIWLGAAALSRLDSSVLSAMLGILIVAYAVTGLSRRPWRLPRHREKLLGPVVGLVNGVLTGMTGSFVVPGVPYLQALGLPRDQLVQAMGILFTASTVALAAALGDRGMISAGLGLVSGGAVVPALAGMAAGQRLRRRLPEATFRKVFFCALAVLGAYIVLQAGR